MKSYLIAAPTDEVVTLTEVKTMLGITSSSSDDMLTAMILAVVGELDAASGGWLGRALRPQTWELRMSGFPGCEMIRLPYPPVTELSSVKYDDANGVEQTLVEGTGYRVFGLGDMWKTSVAPVYNGYWPSARCDVESVRIQYVAGYAPAVDPDPDRMPSAIKAAIALGVRQLQSNAGRDLYLSAEDYPADGGMKRWMVSDAAARAIERSIGGLLGGLRIYA